MSVVWVKWTEQRPKVDKRIEVISVGYGKAPRDGDEAEWIGLADRFVTALSPGSNMAHVWWRYARDPGWDIPAHDKEARVEAAAAAQIAPRKDGNRDALGVPLRAGEAYVSSPLGLVPVSVEGVRLLADEIARLRGAGRAA